MDPRFETNMETLTDVAKKGTRRKERSAESVKASEDIRPVSSCRQAPNKSGRYMIQIGENTTPFEVLCEQNTHFGGGWIVIQQRLTGSVDFYRNWTEYRNGFGDLESDFWLGLEHMHQITNNRPHELLVELKDFKGKYIYARYNEFEIGSETDQFKLTKLGNYSGTAGNSMANNKGFKFSTFDRSHDNLEGRCPNNHQAGWWFYHCTQASLNGRLEDLGNDWRSVFWYHYKYEYRGMAYARMLIRDIVN
ncbi:AGAP011223-PA-like protein [Anopheles sinensis]|uniref:AGAP011223-PA-like protein n=1 Tax=Anopheles sinensis TaxID=74873 RepID=A0A084VKE5_ANOSI|nr:AGAP011223-PA-like protein [Anopheles sinensis]